MSHKRHYQIQHILKESTRTLSHSYYHIFVLQCIRSTIYLIYHHLYRPCPSQARRLKLDRPISWRPGTGYVTLPDWTPRLPRSTRLFGGVAVPDRPLLYPYLCPPEKRQRQRHSATELRVLENGRYNQNAFPTACATTCRSGDSDVGLDVLLLGMDLRIPLIPCFLSSAPFSQFPDRFLECDL